ncbi:helix-turn-helix transcriptional regulator [Faecalicatena sp. AGMB00832]|uniref:Helix-turn-helix transcriptional regulator n=1 Tax=Faecalicatena faecalis TaxID=2726362 RepID=A0ABS6D4G5_9FIRM|nr:MULTISPECIES: helix-turn-helix transcriptional regulator [Faecalicatena]MBU3876487.1 helix-turn-helix transcriptional regulator [Faecalicatena faecalis]MCI6465381.1 helix-turn-helix transcriptional regulator [Faecalicatena sp.]MDY5617213.1 helix-turn-helix transcriptional regulator [Lachnospiraceae bacterium]
MADFAKVLRLLRNKKGFSQQELADSLGISKSAVNMYERGERQPNFETLELIADYFNVDLDYLLGRTTQASHSTEPVTIAAHLDTEDLTQDELDDVANYIAFIKNKRNK